MRGMGVVADDGKGCGKSDEKCPPFNSFEHLETAFGDLSLRSPDQIGNICSVPTVSHVAPTLRTVTSLSHDQPLRSLVDSGQGSAHILLFLSNLIQNTCRHPHLPLTSDAVPPPSFPCDLAFHAL